MLTKDRTHQEYDQVGGSADPEEVADRDLLEGLA
jgi:hypothetical protein